MHQTTKLFLTSLAATLVACAPQPGLKSLVISPASLTVTVGERATLRAFGAGADAKVLEVAEGLTWSVGDAAIAEVSEGQLKALQPGRTTIQATAAPGGASASMELVVTDARVVSLAIEPSAPALPLGVTQPFTVTATFSDGTSSDATTRVTWSSSDTAVASITDRGVLTTRRPGTSTVRADLGPVHAVLTVRVTSAELSELVVSAARTLIPKGAPLQLKAMGLYTDGSMLDVTTSVQWSTRDAPIASISNMEPSRGLLTGLSTGLTEVVATDPLSGKVGRFSVGVSDAELVRLDLSHPGLVVPVLNNGEGTPMRAIATYSDATTADLTLMVVWSSSAPLIAQVSPTGTVTSQSPGDVEIIATFGTTVARVRFRVSAPVLQRLEIVGPTVAMRMGETFPLTVNAVYSDGSTQDVTRRVVWSSPPAIALLISQEEGSEGLLWMGRATTPTMISATLGTRSASVSILAANPTSLPFFTNAFRVSPMPVTKRSITWMSSKIDYGGTLGGRELIAITPVMVTARTTGVTVTLLDGPGLKGQIWFDGPTGGTFTVSHAFPFGVGTGTQQVTLP